MRTVYLGTSDFAAGVLQALSDSAHSPALVITRPDRPRGRGRKVSAPPVAEKANELGIALLQPQSVNSEEVVAEVEAGSPDAIVVCAFGALIKEPLLSLREMLNVHPSLLPRWRGAAPIERAIIAGDARTGVSIMRLTAGLDSGPVCLADEVEIAPEDDYGSLSQRLCELGGRLIVRALDDMQAGAGPRFEEQDEAGVTYAEKIGPEDRMLDPGRGPQELARVVRALHPHIGARIEMQSGDPLGVQRAVAFSADASTADARGDAASTGNARADASSADARGDAASAGNARADASSADARGDAASTGNARADASTADARGDAASAGVAGSLPAPGVLADVEGRLLYGVSGGALELLEVQPPGKRPMDAQAYLRGHAL